MCGVFYVDDDTIKEVRKIVQAVDQKILERNFARDIYPTEKAFVITGEKGGLKLSHQRWGYPGFKRAGVIINARAESVREKKLFARGIRYHRAVIPAKRFYEWNGNREKNSFCRMDGRILYFAGFFDVLDNEERFVILTTEANDTMRKIHDRMPLLLEEDQLEDWVYHDGCTDDILGQSCAALKRRADYEQMTLF